MTNVHAMTTTPSQADSTPTWKGVQYPLRTDGMLNLVVDEHSINAGLYQLFMTEPGERLMEVGFGTRLRDLLFEQESQSVYDEIAERIMISISRWEKRIVLTEPVKVSNKLSDIYVDASQPQRIEEIENGVFVYFSWSFKAKLDELFEFSAAIARASSNVAFVTTDSEHE